MWNKMRPLMHTVADMADTYERFGNALSPTKPFPQELYRLRIAAVIIPLFAASFFITNYMIMVRCSRPQSLPWLMHMLTLVFVRLQKSITFGVGFGFFGDPVIQPGIDLLNKTFPHWQKLLELRNSILHGVPTNAQLALTLLRIGEANKAPLPPPPSASQPPPDQPIEMSDDHLRAVGADYPLNATDEEIKAAMQHDPSVAGETLGTDIEAASHKQHGKKGTRLLAFFKTGVKGTVETALGADRLKAKVGSEHAKERLGVIPDDRESQLSGPVDFNCRYHGKRGSAYISASATIPCISFTADKSAIKHTKLNGVDDHLHPIWSVAINDIKELKKVGGLGWKAKLVVGWALDREVADGIEIVDKQGNSWVLTAMVLRDELFNRLIAMGGQKWEAW